MEILLTGATGFVGRHLYADLVAAGHVVVCASRDPSRAAKRFPGRSWVYLDTANPSSVVTALRGCDAAYYLVHGIGTGKDYPRREEHAAHAFARAARWSSLSRVVYLGGMEPQGTPSRHLASRLRCGAILRGCGVPTVELRASMIIGPGSASWRICRDLALRLPVMVLPRWLRSQTQPVAIEDVVVALVAALSIDPGVYDVPGPETLSIREILEQVARLAGTRPLMIDVPLVTPHLSAYWIRLVTRSSGALASELVEGLRSDILARDEGIWRLLPDYERMSFAEAARLALAAEEATVSRLGHAVEHTIHRAARKA